MKLARRTLLLGSSLAAFGGFAAVFADAPWHGAGLFGAAWLLAAGAGLAARAGRGPGLPLPGVGYTALLEADHELLILDIGPAIETLTGWTVQQARQPGWRARQVDPATLSGLDIRAQICAGAAHASVEYALRRPDGSSLWVRDRVALLARDGAGLRLAGTLEDISGERILALQAAAAQRHAALGEMAASLAHELNQPIATMALAAENAAEALEQGGEGIPEAGQRLRRIMAQADRARHIISQMRGFAQLDPGAAEPVALRDAVAGVLALAGGALEEAGIGVEVILPPDLPEVLAQPLLLDQAILNLVLNARDALTSAPTAAPTLRFTARQEDGEVALLVADNGPGLSEAVRERLFEPFFTTKPAGKGTGLGLSIARSVMRAAGGRINALPAPPGGGACFALTFRVARPAAAGQRVAAD
jgi:signal transduction histidine kinase